MGQAPSSAKAAPPHAIPTLFPLPSDESDLPEGAVLDVELEIVSAKVRNNTIPILLVPFSEFSTNALTSPMTLNRKSLLVTTWVSLH